MEWDALHPWVQKAITVLGVIALIYFVFVRPALKAEPKEDESWPPKIN